MVTAALSSRQWRDLRWLVLAPHPDDETLGAGALIAQTAKAGRLAGLVYLTDGAGSHDAAQRLAAARRREATRAVQRLAGGRAQRPVHLDWKDAAPARPGDPLFERTARYLAALCRRWRVDALAVTAGHEPHCDHEAAAALAYAVHARAMRHLVVAEYLVWADRPDQKMRRAIQTAPMAAGQRRLALAAHRSQLTAAHGPGFRLSPEQRRMGARDILYVRRRP